MNEFWVRTPFTNAQADLASIKVANAQGQGFSKFKAIVDSFWLLNPDGRLPQVLLSIYAIVSLSLSLFKEGIWHNSLSRESGIPRWRVRVVIVVAVLMVIIIGSLDDARKAGKAGLKVEGDTFLDSKREERRMFH
jgi:hypothetical protein